MVESARAAEAAGFDLVTVMDHSYQIGGIGPETGPMLEAYTTLAALAANALVTGVTSHRRADGPPGRGADHHQAHVHRGAAVIRRQYYRIVRAPNRPRPIQPGGPKILVGGGGEKRTLKLLARHGDIGHWFGGNLDDLKRKKERSLRTSL